MCDKIQRFSNHLFCNFLFFFLNCTTKANKQANKIIQKHVSQFILRGCDFLRFSLLKWYITVTQTNHMKQIQNEITNKCICWKQGNMKKQTNKGNQNKAMHTLIFCFFATYDVIVSKSKIIYLSSLKLSATFLREGVCTDDSRKVSLSSSVS